MFLRGDCRKLPIPPVMSLMGTLADPTPGGGTRNLAPDYVNTFPQHVLLPFPHRQGANIHPRYSL